MASQDWYYTENGQQRGPVDLNTLHQLASAGQLKAGDLVWCESMASWSPAQSVSELVSAFPPAAAAPVYPQGAGAYGSAVPMASSLPGYAVPPYAAAMPGYAPGGVMGYYAPQSTVAFAGFWLRFCASFIDGLILLVPILILAAALYFALGIDELPGNYGSPSRSATPASVVFELGVRVIGLLIGWIYFAKMESGPHMATFGKRACGIQVTDEQGGRVSFGRASGRFFGKIVSGLICYIGYMMAGWTQKKQGLHDIMASTLVVRKNSL